MSYGLEVWNASGVKTLHYTSRLTRFHSKHLVGVAPGVVYVSVPGISANGSWFVYQAGYFFGGVEYPGTMNIERGVFIESGRFGVVASPDAYTDPTMGDIFIVGRL